MQDCYADGGFMKKKILTLKNKYESTLMWVIGFLLIWEVGAFLIERTKRSPENVLPHSYQIIESIFRTELVNGSQTIFQIVLSNTGTTLFRAVLGYVIGAFVGYVLALLMNLFRPLEKMIFPYLMLIQMIPILGMAPIVLAITKDIDKSRIVIAAILTFYPVATNTLAGLRAVEPQRQELMHSYAASRFEIYRKLLIPSSMPYLFTGLKISAPMAVTASILVDTLQGGGGLGCILSQSLKHATSIYIFWQIVLLSAIVGIGSYYGISLLEKLFTPSKRKKGGLSK